MLAGLIGLQVLNLSAPRIMSQTLDHSAHFGGILAGVIGAQIMLWRSQVQHKSEKEEPLATGDASANSDGSRG